MENKRQLALLMFFLVCMGLMIGACSKKSFRASEGSVMQKCVPDRPELSCETLCQDTGTCVESYDYTIQTDAQVKDILFAVDVSGSMSEEQKRMGSMFPDMLKILNNVDYRIAITTTDVRDVEDIRTGGNLPDPVNGNGAFQDGNLIPFENGSYYLDGSLPQFSEQGLFEQAIQWNQTLICEDNAFHENFCPSGDERGILAAAMTFQKNPASFIRPVGHMALVILSDEDEGSVGDLPNSIVEPYRENPQKFINYFKGLYPNKSLTVHSLVVRPRHLEPKGLDPIRRNGHTKCFNDQDGGDEAPSGKYGEIYAQLTRLTPNGVLGDICADDNSYSAQLQRIGESVSQVREVLPCTPINSQVTVTLIPTPPYPVSVVKNMGQNEITFSEDLPEGTEVRFQFQCAK